MGLVAFVVGSAILVLLELRITILYRIAVAILTLVRSS